METHKLIRPSTSDQGTKGVLIIDDWECCTLELPWKYNECCLSCIPDGEYVCQFIRSSRYGKCYWVRNVKNRSEILIHYGNLAGDEEEGWKTHSAGCILVGEHFGVLGNQLAVLKSRKTLRRLILRTDEEDFKLIIKSVY